MSVGERELSGAAELIVPTASELRQLRQRIRAGGDPLGDAFCLMRTSVERRVYGATYTPSTIVHAMVEWASKGSPLSYSRSWCRDRPLRGRGGQKVPRGRNNVHRARPFSSDARASEPRDPRDGRKLAGSRHRLPGVRPTPGKDAGGTLYSGTPPRAPSRDLVDLEALANDNSQRSRPNAVSSPAYTSTSSSPRFFSQRRGIEAFHHRS